jgi:hypothetical protein
MKNMELKLKDSAIFLSDLHLLSTFDSSAWCWIFSWAMSHVWANDEYRSQVGATNPPKNIVIRYVSLISLAFMYLHVK